MPPGDLSKTLLENCLSAFLLLMIVRWMLSHFDRREQDRVEERRAMLAEMGRTNTILAELVAELRTFQGHQEAVHARLTAEHAQIAEAQRKTTELLVVMKKEIERCGKS